LKFIDFFLNLDFIDFEIKTNLYDIVI